MLRFCCWAVCTLIIGSVAVPACAWLSPPSKTEVEDIHKRFRDDPFDPDAFAAFKAVLPRQGNLYVVEGDTLLYEDDIRPYFTSSPRRMTLDAPAGETPPTPSEQAYPELIVNVVNGRLDTWGMSRSLSYAVDRASFDSDAKYQTVVAAMASAADEWVTSCPECGISFTHQSNRDGSHPVPDSTLTFVVKRETMESGYIAAAFYPHDDASRRILRLGPRYFRADADSIGVLRHEIGHILGYRHEQIRGVPGCDLEDRNWKTLTNYDRQSVMHHMCGDGGDQVLQLTPLDRVGHRKLYGQES